MGNLVWGNDEVNLMAPPRSRVQGPTSRSHKGSNIVAQTFVTHRDLEQTSVTHRDLE